MKKLILCISTLAILAIACQKLENNVPLNGDEMAPAVKMITETISGSRGADTKATIANDDASFKWSIGDNVAVHVSNGSYVYTSDEGASGATPDAGNPSKASFTVVYPEGSSRDAFAVYPSTIVAKDAANYGQSSQTLDVTLPSEYPLAQVQGEVSPCPMIADNTGASWSFYQICSLLRLTVNDIPSTAKRLVIDFDGKKVCGEFSIPSTINPGTSVISTKADADHDIITITNGGSELGQTSLTVNIPLPLGVYTKITVYVYDAISGGNLVSANQVGFSYTATLTKAVKKTISLANQGEFTFISFTFRDKAISNEDTKKLGGLRFVRIFSCQNKLNSGPYTDSRARDEADLANPFATTLKFTSVESDQLAFQVIDANGKVYSGICDAPEGGFTPGVYNLNVDVKAYTFTVASGKKVYFSPGDLGVNSGVYSFTDPFVNWAGTTTKVTTVPSQRSWFNYDEVDANTDPATQLYGIQWRIETYVSEAYEWDYLVKTREMGSSSVDRYYKLKVNGNANCLLLPPDETAANDIGDDIKNGSVGSDYAKYLGKGFVLLMNAQKGTYNGAKKTISWSTMYFSYWMAYNNSNARKYIEWSADNAPGVPTPATGQFRMHVRLVRDVPTP